VNCPEAEKACYKEGVSFLQNVLLGDKEDIDNIILAIRKIRDHVNELKSVEATGVGNPGSTDASISESRND
jgi:hypothetical protein